MTKPVDYYEFLQISPNAEPDTINRVYRFLASRLHPDNPLTGDTEKFVQLKEAYDVLSDPKRRAEYDATYKKEGPQVVPLSTSIDFMDNIEGELNRRLALLALLYIRRRSSSYKPEVSLFEVERRMGFPRDYLHFTTWYLQSKKYITVGDNGDFTLTALGVDFVESNRADVPILDKLLTTGSEPYPTEPSRAEPSTPDGATVPKALDSGRTPIIVSAGSRASHGATAPRALNSPRPIILPAGKSESRGTGENGNDEVDGPGWLPGRSKTPQRP